MIKNKFYFNIIKVIYWKGYCDYFYMDIYELEKCRKCKIGNWGCKCWHWNRTW